jgi:hypothetical protein
MQALVQESRDTLLSAPMDGALCVKEAIA